MLFLKQLHIAHVIQQQLHLKRDVPTTIIIQWFNKLLIQQTIFISLNKTVGLQKLLCFVFRIPPLHSQKGLEIFELGPTVSKELDLSNQPLRVTSCSFGYIDATNIDKCESSLVASFFTLYCNLILVNYSKNWP